MNVSISTHRRHLLSNFGRGKVVERGRQ